MDLYLALQIGYDIALVACCAFAIWRGGGDERIGAAIMLAGSALTVVSALLPGFDWASSRTGIVIVDLAVLGALLVLALQSNRFWPLWMTSFHLIAVTTHLIVLVEAASVLAAYVMLQGFWAYPMLVALVLGTAGFRASGKTRMSLR